MSILNRAHDIMVVKAFRMPEVPSLQEAPALVASCYDYNVGNGSIHGRSVFARSIEHS